MEVSFSVQAMAQAFLRDNLSDKIDCSNRRNCAGV